MKDMDEELFPYSGDVEEVEKINDPFSETEYNDAISSIIYWTSSFSIDIL